MKTSLQKPTKCESPKEAYKAVQAQSAVQVEKKRTDLEVCPKI